MSKTESIIPPQADQTSLPRPRLIWREGRGRVGASTIICVLIELAMRAGRRNLIAADGDYHNQTVSRSLTHYGEIVRKPPKLRDLESLKNWTFGIIGEASQPGRTTLLDMGGNDSMPERLAEDIDLPEALTEAGIEPIVYSFVGRGSDDILNAHEAWKRGGFSNVQKRVLFLNGGVGQPITDAAHIMEIFMKDARVREMVSTGAVPIAVPYLASLAKMEQEEYSIFDAMDGKTTKSGQAQSIFWRPMARKWLETFEENVRQSARPDLLP